MKAIQSKYTHIKEDILRSIECGELTPGDCLPGVRTMSEQFDCHFHTVRRAIKELSEAGYLVAHQGKGTFVTDKAAVFVKRSVSTEKVLHPTDRIAVLLPLQQWGTYASSLMDELHRQAENLDLQLNIRTVRNIEVQTAGLASELRAQGCCAILIPWTHPDQHPADLQDFVRASELPVVLPDRIDGLEPNYYRNPEIHHDRSHTETAFQCQYFQALGYRNIALLTSYTDRPDRLHRKMIEYTQWVNQERRPNLLELVNDNVDSIIDRWSPMKGQLAVIASDDALAMQFMAACKRKRLRIPEDIALMGQNYAGNLSSSPRLSSLACPYKQIAKAMLAHAQALSHESSWQLSEPLPLTVVVRDSCGARLKQTPRTEPIPTALLHKATPRNSRIPIIA